MTDDLAGNAIFEGLASTFDNSSIDSNVDTKYLTPLDVLIRVLMAVAKADAHDLIWWRNYGEYSGAVDPAPIAIFAVCSDVFEWATADCEQITESNIECFEKSLQDVLETSGGDPTWGAALFAARVRGMRPQGASYPTDRRLWPLFDWCGPERQLDALNPHLPGKGEAIPNDQREGTWFALHTHGNLQHSHHRDVADKVEHGSHDGVRLTSFREAIPTWGNNFALTGSAAEGWNGLVVECRPEGQL